MSGDGLEALVEALVWEGYALYPYTPGATKNATPTPFGIVYPPAYAARLESTHDHLELRCVLRAGADAVLSGQVRLLVAVGVRHQARAETIELPGVMLGALGGGEMAPVTVCCCFDGGQDDPAAVHAAATLSADKLGEGEYEVALRVENRTVAPGGLDRAGALRRSLLSVHPLLRVQGGRFISVLERPCNSVNTFPVLASDADDVILGAAIMLPDHPRLAPESLGNLFDGTEIEEVLLLHLRTLSDAERAEIERQDPAVREMLARAAAATPEEIISLHGRMELRDAQPARPREQQTTEPPREPDWLPDPQAGVTQTEVGGRRFCRGDKLLLRPGPDADLHARMLQGRTATLERILTDYDGRVHLGVTIDEDPGQQLMRETGRYLYFFAEEVEVIGR
jgi:hypothetical protein